MIAPSDRTAAFCRGTGRAIRLADQRNAFSFSADDSSNLTVSRASVFTLPGNATDEVTFSFVNHYDKLGDGRYRIVMNFSSMDGSTAIAAAEFGIGRAEK